MGSITLLDTNVLIYHADGKLKDPLGQGQFAISVITEMEALGFTGLDKASSLKLQELISGLTVIYIDSEIKEKAIELRQTTSLRLPDAIIAATAIVTNAELLTHDESLLKLTMVQSKAPELIPDP